MSTYTLEMRVEGGVREEIEIEAASLEEARERVELACETWLQDGDWGDEGAAVTCWWTLTDDAGDELDEGSVLVEIEPQHSRLIAAAGGDPNCDHEWTSEGEGGCSENPGVWSTGGTSMSFSTHCKKCGLHRLERTTGSQRNPGDHDTVEYRQPATWCPECEREECECEE